MISNILRSAICTAIVVGANSLASAQELTSFPDVENLPETELTKAFSRHTIHVPGKDTSEGILLSLAFRGAYRNGSLGKEVLNQSDKMIFAEAFIENEVAKENSNVLLDEACLLLSEGKANIHAVATLTMQADEEFEEALSNYYMQAYLSLSPTAKEMIDQAVADLSSGLQTQKVDYAALSLERPDDMQRLLKGGCERRKNRPAVRKGPTAIQSNKESEK